MIHFILNNRDISTDKPYNMTVLDFLRSRERITSVKAECSAGSCGTCLILTGEPDAGAVAYRPVNSCILPLGEVNGKHLVTLEGLNSQQLNPIQQAMAEQGAVQCGYCTPGIVIADKFALPTLLVAGTALLLNGPLSAAVVLCACFALYMRMLAPMGMLNFLNIASRHGILIKDGRALDLLNKVDTVIFDKTGTLTEETPHIGLIYALEGYKENDILMYAAAAEYKQTHPIAKAVLREAKTRGIRAPLIRDAEYKVGYGITVMTEGRIVRVGSARFINAEGIAIPPDIEKINAEGYRQGHSLLMIAVNDKLAGAVELHAILRPEASAVIRELKLYGKSMYVISGDHEIPTRTLTRKLGIDHYFAETLPENKADLIGKLQEEGKFVCYVGDGINDSIALKKANVSVSLRGASTIATDTAQIILMDGSLNQIVRLFDLSQDFDATMEAALVTTMIPGSIIIPGAFFLNFQIIHAVLLNQASLALGTGIMMRPLLKWKKLEKAIREPDSNSHADTPEKVRATNYGQNTTALDNTITALTGE